jgi:hypothetical protein
MRRRVVRLPCRASMCASEMPNHLLKARSSGSRNPKIPAATSAITTSSLTWSGCGSDKNPLIAWPPHPGQGKPRRRNRLGRALEINLIARQFGNSQPRAPASI